VAQDILRALQLVRRSVALWLLITLTAALLAVAR
jgi:cobalamin biosynthesis protein CobD/CbiB